MAPLTIFQRNPRNVRIAAWVMAVGAAFAWYKYDEKKAREFSDTELQQWNQDVLRKNPNRAKKSEQREFSDAELQQWNQDVLRKNPNRAKKSEQSTTSE